MSDSNPPGNGSGKRRSIDPGRISAWITLGGTVFGLLSGLARVTESAYNPIDTLFIYMFVVALILYAITFIALMILGLVFALIGEEYFTPIVSIVLGIALIAIAVPIAISVANDNVSEGGEFDAIAMFFFRFVGIGMIVLTAWLVNKYLLNADDHA